MRQVLVTGCAGFIGSTLCERLLGENYKVLGVDCFTNNYDRFIKERNMQSIELHSNFSFIEQDLLHIELRALLDKIDVVYHLAALPGVRSSWGQHFVEYVNHNILSTQVLLEAMKCSSVKKLVYASSSSVYGGMSGPVSEDTNLHPISPYGVTKLSAEQLCQLYAENFNVPVISLRYFTVFGPKQRPDMALHKFIAAVLLGRPIEVYGDGEQTRDFTYVDDIVAANMLAGESSHNGQVFNVGGGCRATVNHLIRIIERQTGKKAHVRYVPAQPGDPKHTSANIDKAKELLGYHPRFDLERGIYLQIQDMRNLYNN